MQKLRKKRSFFNTDGKMDITFLSFVLILLTIGLVMLFSASYAFSFQNYGNSYRFISRQLIYAVVGVVIMFFVSRIDYHVYRKFAWLLYICITAILIFLLCVPPMLSGKDVKRWLVIGPINLQPSELAKFAVILLLASLIAANYKLMQKFGFVAFLLALVAVPCLLIVLEPHVSATILVFCIGITLIFCGGIKRSFVIIGGIAAAVAVAVLVFSGAIGYASDRVTYWIDPWSDPNGKGYQVIQSLLAIGSGGIWGRGIGQSLQKHLWVPEPHNDFIFSIIRLTTVL